MYVRICAYTRRWNEFVTMPLGGYQSNGCACARNTQVVVGLILLNLTFLIFDVDFSTGGYYYYRIRV